MAASSGRWLCSVASHQVLHSSFSISGFRHAPCLLADISLPCRGDFAWSPQADVTIAQTTCSSPAIPVPDCEVEVKHHGPAALQAQLSARVKDHHCPQKLHSLGISLK